jgi:hypothetical protein
MVEKVFEFPRGRAKPLSEAEALDWLLDHIRREGCVEVASITALGKIWLWTQSRSSKAVIRWERAGHIMREQGAGGKIIIRFPGQERQEREQEQAQEGVQERQEAQEQGQEQSIVSAQEHGVHADVPAVPAHVPATLPAVHVPAGVPAPVEGYGVLAWCQWAASVGVLACRWFLGGLFVLLSLALYGASLFLNATFWPGLAPAEDAKAILRVVGVVVETVNFTVPSAVSIASTMMSRAFKRGLWTFWIVTMTTAAVAGASFLRSNLGAAEVSREATIKERARLEAIVNSVAMPVSNDAVVDARNRVETARANRKSDCPRNRSLDIEVCNRAKTALVQADADLKQTNETHDADVRGAEQRHRDDVAKAKAALEALPVISADKNLILAGIMALVPGLEDGTLSTHPIQGEVLEAWANRITVWLWVAIFSFGPCLFLRAGLALLAPARTTPQSRGGLHQ